MGSDNRQSQHGRDKHSIRSGRWRPARPPPWLAGSAAGTLGMGKWFWFPDPFGPRRGARPPHHMPWGPGPCHGQQPPVRCAPSRPPIGWGLSQNMCREEAREHLLGPSFPRAPDPLSTPALSSSGAPWVLPTCHTPSTEMKRDGRAQGRQRCAWQHSLLFINHENSGSRWHRPGSAHCRGSSRPRGPCLAQPTRDTQPWLGPPGRLGTLAYGCRTG